MGQKAHCLNCGAELVTRAQKRFCDFSCQQSLARRTRVERWLETGFAPYVRGGGHYIWLYLFDDQAGRCAICAMESEWNGAPPTFIVDHIDGDASNNCRDNLRLVCPNCDSQLPTFKARNRGNGRAWRRQRYADGKSY
jgi:hypothetical protein